MILTLFIFLEIIMIGTFFTSYFSKQEILWGVSLVLSGALMIMSYSIQIGTYVFNEATNSYVFEMVTHSFPVMMGINMLFFALSLILGFFDVFDKYNINFSSKFKKKR